MTTSPLPAPVALVSVRMPMTVTPHLLTRTPHPPSGPTTFLVTLGLLRTHWQLLALMLAVAIATAVLLTVNRQARRPRLLTPTTELLTFLPAEPSSASAPLPSALTAPAPRPVRKKKDNSLPPVKETAARRAAEILVATMPTPLWPMARARAVRLLARGDSAREAEVRRRLNLSRTALAEAAPAETETVHRAVVQQWNLAFIATRGRDPHTPALLHAFSDTFAHLLVTAVPGRDPDPR
ncbi:hypothetical protein ACFYY8_06970 [Streptosporangium sp. NPDC001559]|uniref:hypothetical protein n=1 Tax=Streptosporangium sp. NPDC001559 TaxID=3366187 RepID=UPI0036EBC0DB